MATQKNIQWISEKEAAEIMGLTPRYFREHTIGRFAGKYPIGFTRPSRNKILYNKVDIDNYLYQIAELPLR